MIQGINPYGMFYNFAGFLGYMVLAHYLAKYPLAWSWKKMLAITVPLFLYTSTVYLYLSDIYETLPGLL